MLAGLDDPVSSRILAAPARTLAQVFEETPSLPRQAFALVMDHRPGRAFENAAAGASLQLSGHTHAGQLRIGNWSPIQYTYPEWGGLYNDAQHGLGGSGKRMLLVSSGLGGTNHFRLGARPEVNLVILHRKK